MYGEGDTRGASADGMTRQGCSYTGYTVFAGEFVPEGGSKDFKDYYEVRKSINISTRFHSLMSWRVSC